MIKVKNKTEAFALATRLLQVTCIKNKERSKAAGYNIYTPIDDSDKGWISDLGDRYEINYPSGESENIWIDDKSTGKLTLYQLLQRIAKDTWIVISMRLYGLRFSTRYCVGYGNFLNGAREMKDKEVSNIRKTKDGDIEITLKM